jgi:hypothetical protein
LGLPRRIAGQQLIIEFVFDIISHGEKSFQPVGLGISVLQEKREKIY